MRVVIDTNVLVISIPGKSKYRPIFDAYLFNKISLVITTSIFFEYVEILQQLSKSGIAKYIEDSLVAASNVITPSIYYYWQLVDIDVDDNKFTDAYIAGDAEYLVTNDTHFADVKRKGFPNINIVSADEFLEIINNL